MLEHFVYFTGVGLFITEKCSNVTHLTEDWNISSFSAWDLFFFLTLVRKRSSLVYNSANKFILGHYLPFQVLAKRQLFA